MIILGRYFGFLAIVLIFTTLDMWLNIIGFFSIKATILTASSLLISTLLLYVGSNQTKKRFLNTLREAVSSYFLLYIFIVYSLITVLLVSDIGTGSITQSFLFLYALFFIICSTLVICHDYRTVSKFIGIALIILCLSVFVDVFSPGYFGNYPQRAAGFPQNPTRAAIAVNFALIGALSYENNSKTDILYITVAGLALIAIMSKTGIFIFISTMILYLSSRRIKLAKLFFYMILASVLFFIFVQLFILFLYEGSIFSLAGDKILRILSLEAITDLSVRQTIWKDYLLIVNENLFFGKGAGYLASLDQMGAHNFFLHTIIEYGIVGLTLILVILVLSGIICVKVKGRALSVYMAFLLLSLVHSTPLYERPVLFMIAFAIVIACRKESAKIGLWRHI